MFCILVLWIMTLCSHINGYSIVKCSMSSSPWVCLYVLLWPQHILLQ